MNNSRYKFRAWDVFNKRMGHFEPGFSWNDEYDLWYISQEVIEHDRQITDVPCGDNIIMMLWSGLSDKNEKDIYEGDIITYSLPDIEEEGKPQTFTEYTEVVEFKEGQFGVEIIPLYAAIDFGAIVIGNIYQNPELLK